MDYVGLVNKRWKIEEDVVPRSEYLVTDHNSEDKEEKHLLCVFETNQEYRTCIAMYEKVKGKEELEANLKGKFKSPINAVFDHGEHKFKGIETEQNKLAGKETDGIYFLVLGLKGETLADLLEKETFDYLSKLNLLIKLIKQLQKIHRMGFYLCNFKPSNIMVERVNEKNKDYINLHFTRFNECCSSRGTKYYSAFEHKKQDSIVTPSQLFESDSARPHKYSSYNKDYGASK
jgi:serine/threonine protein kinase